MMSPKVSVVLSVLFLLSASSGAEQETFDKIQVSSSVLVRLTNVEDVLKQIQDENKKLRQANKELAERLDQVEEVCQARALQFLAYRKRLKTAEKEILYLKIRDQKDKNGIHSEINEPKTDNRKQNSLEHNNAITDPEENSRTMKKRNVIRPDDVTQGSISKLLLLPMSTPAITPSYKGPRIAFSAHTSGHLKNLGASEKILFTTVNDNESGAYDQQTGVFICPVAGTYHFEATIMSWYGQRVDTSIMVNGSARAKMVSQGSSASEYGQSTNSMNIRLKPGDHVWVQHYGGAVGATVHGDHYSHFGGFILWAD